MLARNSEFLPLTVIPLLYLTTCYALFNRVSHVNIKKWSILVAMALSACASTGIIPTGGGVYMVAKESPGCGLATADATLATLYKQANAFCENEGKKLETVSVESKDGIPFVRCAEANLHFRCV